MLSNSMEDAPGVDAMADEAADPPPAIAMHVLIGRWGRRRRDGGDDDGLLLFLLLEILLLLPLMRRDASCWVSEGELSSDNDDDDMAENVFLLQGRAE